MTNISSYLILSLILFIIVTSFIEKKKTFSNFILGCREGLRIVLEIYPILLGLFVSIALLRTSGLIENIEPIFYPITKILKIPNELIPFILIRPISGSATMALAIDFMKKYRVDSFLGIVISVIMGSTETTLYTLSIYTRGKKYKNAWQVLMVGIIGDLLAIIISVRLCSFLS